MSSSFEGHGRGLREKANSCQLTFPNAIYCDAFPEGRAKDFLLRTVVGTPSAPDMANLFVVGPQLTRLALAQFFGPVFKPVGESRKCMCGGDEAMVEKYEGDVLGTVYTCRVIYVKRKDVAVAVLAVGTEIGFKEFGRAIEIAAQSITLTHRIMPILVEVVFAATVLASFGSETQRALKPEENTDANSQERKKEEKLGSGKSEEDQLKEDGSSNRPFSTSFRPLPTEGRGRRDSGARWAKGDTKRRIRAADGMISHSWLGF